MSRMRIPRVTGILSFSIAAFALAVLNAADWPQWRGPDRNAVVTDSPKLIGAVPETGIREAWKSEAVFGKNKNGGWTSGWGSITVANNKVYVFANTKSKLPITTRTLTLGDASRLGYHKSPMPEELAKKVEEARLSSARAKIKGWKPARAWAQKWIKENMDKKYRKFDRTVQARLESGKGGVSYRALEKIREIVNKEFPNQEEINAWFAGSGLSKPDLNRIKRRVRKDKDVAVDRVFALDAKTGKQLWQFEGKGTSTNFPSSATPTIANGRCYVAGSNGNIYCFNASTGKGIWSGKTKASPHENLSSSILLVDDKAILLAGILTAFDAGTGKIVWAQPSIRGKHSSPITWTSGGRTYVIANADDSGTVNCVDPNDGKVLWSVPGGMWSTPAISGNKMVLVRNSKNDGVVAYRISPGKAERVWGAENGDRGTSPVIYEGNVYVTGGARFGGGRAACYGLNTGKLNWSEKTINSEISSPIIADGKIIYVCGTNRNAYLWVLEATPEKFTPLARTNIAITECLTPAFVDGFICLRSLGAVVCYDLRAK